MYNTLILDLLAEYQAVDLNFKLSLDGIKDFRSFRVLEILAQGLQTSMYVLVSGKMNGTGIELLGQETDFQNPKWQRMTIKQLHLRKMQRQDIWNLLHLALNGKLGKQQNYPDFCGQRDWKRETMSKYY